MTKQQAKIRRRNKFIVRRYVDDKLSLREVGKRFGLTAQAISDILKKEGVARRTRAESFHLAYLHSNASLKTICPECGGEKRAYAKRCWECHINSLASGRDEKYDLIEVLWEQGFTIAQIADALNTSIGAVGVMINRMRFKHGRNLPYRHDEARRHKSQEALKGALRRT